MKTMAAGTIASLLFAGSASAASDAGTDGGTAANGACNGVAIDFDVFTFADANLATSPARYFRMKIGPSTQLCPA
jgi:hypothetical protein